MKLKGHLPTLLLKVLSRGPNHGYRIAQDVKARSKGVLEFKEGTLYPALHLLESKGLIESDEQVEQGRTRRYYRLTERGVTALEEQKEEWKRVSTAISLILEEG